MSVQLCSRGDKRLKGSSDNLTGLRQRRINRSNSDLVSFGVKEKRGPSEPLTPISPSDLLQNPSACMAVHQFFSCTGLEAQQCAECQLELPGRCQRKYRTAVQQASILKTGGSCHRQCKAHNARTLDLLPACQFPVLFGYLESWHPCLTCISEDSSVLFCQTSTSAAAVVNQEGHPIDRQQAKGFSPALVLAVEPIHTEAVPGIGRQADLFSADYFKELPFL